MKQQKLRDNYRYRALWGHYKSDKYKKKLTIISEIADIIRDLWHPTVTKEDLIELKTFLKRKIYSDADEKLPPLTFKQRQDYYSMNHKEFKEKWGDQL